MSGLDSSAGRRHDQAASLRDAAQTGKPIPPLTVSDPTLDVAAAYEIQRIGIQVRLKEGRRVVGRKVGLTSRPMQEMLGIDEPDFGVILDDMVISSGEVIEIGRLIQPRVEAEIAFILAHELVGPGIGVSEVVDAVDHVVAALEVIDSRIEAWRISLADTVADNASSAMVVLAHHGLAVDELDLRLAGVVFSRNGAMEEVGAGAAVLGHPAAGVAWLANKLSEFGESLHAGDLVMAGALHRAVPASPGDVFLAEFAWLGRVEVRFSTIGAAA